MLKDSDSGSMSQCLTSSFSRVSSFVAQKICETAKISTRASQRIGRQEADALYRAIQVTGIPPPSTDCISRLGGINPQRLAPAGSGRPPQRRALGCLRGNPFVIEVGPAYGMSPTGR
jgi:DNA topoisomerase VI subunit B